MRLAFEIDAIVHVASRRSRERQRAEPVVMSDSEPEPDVAVVRGSETDYLKRHPEPADVCLVIEVSVSSLLTDRYKAEIYAEAGIPNYWIVNLINSQLESYSQPELTPAGLRYSNCQHLGPGDRLQVILEGRNVGSLSAEEMLPAIPRPA